MISGWTHNYINEKEHLNEYQMVWHDSRILQRLRKGDIYSQNINKSEYQYKSTAPFYIVYINRDGEVLSNHLNVKSTLDIASCTKWHSEPIKEGMNVFNDETNVEWMHTHELLSQSIQSIIHVKRYNNVVQVLQLLNTIKGLKDFELITFVIIK
jgi:hypothetical protein